MAVRIRSSEPLSVVAQRAWSASARSSEAGGTKACSSVSGSPSRNWPSATQERSRDCTGQTCSRPVDLEDERVAGLVGWAPGAAGR